MIECKEEDCDSQFDTERGASTHHTVVHKESNTIECVYECCGKRKDKYPSEIGGEYADDINNSTTELNLPVCGECQKKGGKYGGNWQGGKVDVECDRCGNITEMWPYRAKKIKGCCCGECSSDWRKNEVVGENHPQFKPNTVRQTKYYGEDWLEMRRKAREKFNNTCQVCGKTKDELSRTPPIHHIVPVASFKNNNDANYMGNLTQLCDSCHGKVENNMNSIEQMEEFSKDYLVITSEENL